MCIINSPRPLVSRGGGGGVENPNERTSRAVGARVWVVVSPMPGQGIFCIWSLKTVFSHSRRINKAPWPGGGGGGGGGGRCRASKCANASKCENGSKCANVTTANVQFSVLTTNVQTRDFKYNLNKLKT